MKYYKYAGKKFFFLNWTHAPLLILCYVGFFYVVTGRFVYTISVFLRDCENNKILKIVNS